MNSVYSTLWSGTSPRSFTIVFFLIMMLAGASLFAMDCRVQGAVTPDDREEIEIIIENLSQTYGPIFQLDGNFRLDIRVCGDLQEFLTQTGARSWNAGFFQNRTIYLQRLPVLKEREILTQTLTHEFLHFCIWRISGNNCPIWLNEGLVLNLSGEIHSLPCDRMPSPLPSPHEIPINQLLRSDKPEKSELAYCIAAHTVKRFIAQKGLKSILQQIKNYN